MNLRHVNDELILDVVGVKIQRIQFLENFHETCSLVMYSSDFVLRWLRIFLTYWCVQGFGISTLQQALLQTYLRNLSFNL